MVFQKDKSTKIPLIRVSVHPFLTIPPQCILSNLKFFPDLNGGNVIFLFQIVFPRKLSIFHTYWPFKFLYEKFSIHILSPFYFFSFQFLDALFSGY